MDLVARNLWKVLFQVFVDGGYNAIPKQDALVVESH